MQLVRVGFVAEDRAGVTLKMYPFGNGWRFYELMVDRVSADPRQAMRQRLDKLVNDMEKGVRANCGVQARILLPSPSEDALMHPKRAVARGALKWLRQVMDAVPSPETAKLPVGVPFNTAKTTAEWSDLFVNPRATTANLDNSIQFDNNKFTTLAQNSPNGNSWTSVPLKADDLRSRLQTRDYVDGAGMSYTRSPLQILIEGQWLDHI